MLHSAYRTKFEVTINGSGFDKPTGGSISKTKEIPTANLTFANSRGKLFKHFNGRDVIRIYLGLDEIPDAPIFTGFLKTEQGRGTKKYSLVGRMNAAITDTTILTNTHNLDGMEASEAIWNLVEGLDVDFTKRFTGTNPDKYITKEFRYEKGAFIYDIIKKIRDVVSIDGNVFKPASYALYEIGDELHFEQVPDPGRHEATFQVLYGEDIVVTDPELHTDTIINKQTVIGKNGIIATYTDEQSIALDGVRAGKIINDKTLTTIGACYEQARFSVEQSKFVSTETTLSSPKLLDAMPFHSTVKIIGAPNIVEKNYLVTQNKVSFGSGLSVNTRIENQQPILGKSIFNSLYSIENST